MWRCVVLSSQNWFPVCPGGSRAGRNSRVVWRLVELRLSPRHLRLSLSLSRERAESRYRLFNCNSARAAAAAAREWPWELRSDNVLSCDPVIAGDSSVILIRVRLSWSSPAVYHDNYNNTPLKISDIWHHIKMLLNRAQIRICPSMIRVNICEASVWLLHCWYLLRFSSIKTLPWSESGVWCGVVFKKQASVTWSDDHI